MALQNKEVNAVAPVATQKVKGDINVLTEKGKAILASKTEEEKAVMGEKSNTLHFQYLLGLASKKSTRRVSATETKECSTPVGLVLVSDIDITVPVIDILKDKDTGITPEDISYREVKAGEEFVLSYYEFMYLIVQDEYACVCANRDNPDGIYFSAKMPSYLSGKAQLPTPTINMRGESIKKSITNIDERQPDGTWVMRPDFEEKFGALIRKATPKRSAGAKSQTPTSTLVALALQNILGVQK